mgnify:FL=1
MLFSKIYVINLVRRKDRRTQVEEALKSINIPNNTPIEYVEAVDGQALPSDDTYNIIEGFTDPSTDRVITTGEIGCSLSHQLVFEKAYKEMGDGENILILEDDLAIDPYFMDEVEKIEIESKDIDFDFMYLGRKKVNEHAVEERVSDSLVKPSYSYWTSSILYSKKGLKKILDLDWKNNICVADEFIPMLLNQGQSHIKEHFGPQNFIGLATSHNLISQYAESFATSDTEHSRPFREAVVDKNDFIALAIGTDYNDGMKRLEKSFKRFGYPYELLGVGEQWFGGDEIINYPGAGQKINILKKRLQEIVNEGNNPLILMLDGYDTIVLRSVLTLIKKYKGVEAKVLFGAEKTCWPDSTLSTDYPETSCDWKYLNSGQFIGKAQDILNILDEEVQDSDDDQLYYTKKFLSGNYGIGLDYNCEVFQTFGGTEVELFINKTFAELHNVVTTTKPAIAHGNGPIDSKYYFNYACNFISGNFREAFGYLQFNEEKELGVNNKRILISVFDTSPDPEHIYQCLDSLRFVDHPHENLAIAIYTDNQSRKRGISRYLAQGDFANYESIMLMQRGNDNMLRTKNLKLAKDFDYNFNINSNVYLDKTDIFHELISHDKLVVGAQLSQKNFYLRPEHTEEDDLIFNRNYTGLWAVSYLDACYMIDCSQIDKIQTFFEDNSEPGTHAEATFCYNLVAKGYIPYITNIEKKYGEIIS